MSKNRKGHKKPIQRKPAKDMKPGPMKAINPYDYPRANRKGFPA